MEKLKTLILEDLIPIQKVYQKMLSDNGFEKKIAKDGEAGLTLYESWKPELIILDMGLPIVSGFVVLKKIREEFNDKKTPIIISTTYSQKSSVSQCMKLGVQGYILKPIDPLTLMDKIIEYLNECIPERALQITELINAKEALAKGKRNRISYMPDEIQFMKEIRSNMNSEISDEIMENIVKIKKHYSITNDRAVELESVVFSETFTKSFAEKEYAEELISFLTKRESSISENREILELHRKRLNLLENRCQFIEEMLTVSNPYLNQWFINNDGE